MTITDIGVDNNGLFCFANVTGCCRSKDGSVTPRDWYYPANSAVGNKNKSPISRNRGPRTVILHRSNTSEPSGVYRCEILQNNTYFGIYPANEGELIILFWL